MNRVSKYSALVCKSPFIIPTLIFPLMTLFLFWPGIDTIDSKGYLDAFREFRFYGSSGQESVLYELLIFLSFEWSNSIGFLSIVQIGLLILNLTVLFHDFSNFSRSKFFSFCFLIILTSPLVYYSATLAERDILFGLLFNLSLLFAFKSKFKPWIGRSKPKLVAFFIFFCAVLVRQEALIVSPFLVAFLFGVSGGWLGRAKRFFFIPAAVILGLLAVELNSEYLRETYLKSMEVRLMKSLLGPFFYIFDKLPEAERSSRHGQLLRSTLRNESFNQIELGRVDATSELLKDDLYSFEVREINRAAIGLIFLHPGLFLQKKFDYLKHAFRTPLVSAPLINDHSERRQGSGSGALFRQIKDYVIIWQDKIDHVFSPSSFFTALIIFALFIFCFAPFSWLYFPHLTMLSLLPLVLFVAVFLLQPFGKVKYFYFLMLFGISWGPMLVREVAHRRSVLSIERS